MSKLLIMTQVMENYGDAENPYWKMKGSGEYFVNGADSTEILAKVRSQIECDETMYREYVLGAVVVPDDYMTDFEKSQLEYEGKVIYPAKVLEIV